MAALKMFIKIGFLITKKQTIATKYSDRKE